MYPVEITGRIHDHEWNDRESKAIKVEMPFEDALRLFVNDAKWDIVQEEETPEGIVMDVEYGNSEYCIAGDIVDHRNGYITAKMGKPTAAELLESKDKLWEEMTAAYNAGVQEA